VPLGLSGRVARNALSELLASVASSFCSSCSHWDPEDVCHPLQFNQPTLARELISISTEVPPGSVVDVLPFRITTRHGRSKVYRISEDSGQAVHIGSIAPGRFARLCNIFGQDRVLTSLSSWIQQAEQSERTRGVASARFWQGLRSSLSVCGYIGGTALLLPPYF